MPDDRLSAEMMHRPAPHSTRARSFPWFRLVVAVSLLLIGAGIWQVLQNGVIGAQMPEAMAPVPASDFQLPAVSGDPVNLDSLRGQVVLLNFWATWCPPCKAEMPDLEALHREYGVERTFTVVAINMGEQQAVVDAFRQEYGLTFPILLDAQGLLSVQEYGIRTLPATILIDREGNIRDMWTGQLSRRAMVARLERVW